MHRCQHNRNIYGYYQQPGEVALDKCRVAVVAEHVSTNEVGGAASIRREAVDPVEAREPEFTITVADVNVRQTGVVEFA